jgi:hypothetical protein
MVERISHERKERERRKKNITRRRGVRRARAEKRDSSLRSEGRAI